jgi:hypothetical protein
MAPAVGADDSPAHDTAPTPHSGPVTPLCPSTTPEGRHYQVVTPAPGDTLYVGDTAAFAFCTDDLEKYPLGDSYAIISWYRWTYEYTLSNPSRQFVSWAVPESLTLPNNVTGENETFCTVSDSALIQIFHYGEPNVNNERWVVVARGGTGVVR